MRIYTVILSIMLAATVATTADAAKHMRHHHGVAATVSKTDWAANPYMDATQGQRDAFFRGAFLLGDAK